MSDEIPEPKYQVPDYPTCSDGYHNPDIVREMCLEWWSDYANMFEEPQFHLVFDELVKYQEQNDTSHGSIMSSVRQFMGHMVPRVNEIHSNFVPDFKFVVNSKLRLSEDHFAKYLVYPSMFEFTKHAIFRFKQEYPKSWFDILVLVSPPDLSKRIIKLGIPEKERSSFFNKNMKRLIMFDTANMFPILHHAYAIIKDMCIVPPLKFLHSNMYSGCEIVDYLPKQINIEPFKDGSYTVTRTIILPSELYGIIYNEDAKETCCDFLKTQKHDNVLGYWEFRDAVLKNEPTLVHHSYLTHVTMPTNDPDENEIIYVSTDIFDFIARMKERLYFYDGQLGQLSKQIYNKSQ